MSIFCVLFRFLKLKIIFASIHFQFNLMSETHVYRRFTPFPVRLKCCENFTAKKFLRLEQQLQAQQLQSQQSDKIWRLTNNNGEMRHLHSR